MAIANYFYNETTRRYVALFGTLFNQLKIERSNNAGAETQSIIVPLSYAPFQKVLSRLNSDPDLLNSRRTAMTLPRMSFEITSLNYDSARKLGSTQKIRKDNKAEVDSSRSFMYSSVPYNIEFSLYIMTKYSEDATKIMEQIIPFFTPDWTVTAKMVEDLDPIDIPIVLNSVSTEDLYEGDYETRQTILYTLNFTLKGWYFGPERKQKVIKFIDIDLSGSTSGDATPEESVIIKPGLDSEGNPLTEDGITATAISEVSNGSVSGITIINDGENYNPNNDITVTVAPPAVLDAVISPVIANTSISSITVSEAGGYYSTVPSVTITAPNAPVTTAEGSAVLSNDSIGSINVTEGGTYYTSATVSVSEPPAKSAYVKFGNDALYHSEYTDTFLSHVTDYSLVTAGSGFAIEFWLYPEEFHPNDNTILWFEGTQMRIELESSGEMALFHSTGGAPVRSNPEVLVLNQWNHCRVEHYGTTARWKINGVVDAGGSAPQGLLINGGTNVHVGERSANERSFKGALDNLTITQISGLEVASVYTVPVAPQTGSYFTDNFDKDIATATATVTVGEVTSIAVTNAGSNYANTVPTIIISDPDGVAADYQAVAIANLDDGAVTSITINNSGKFYITANTTIDSVVANTATASITIDGTGQANNVVITNPGSGYRSAPTVTIGNPAAISVPYTQIEFDDDWGIITIFEDV